MFNKLLNGIDEKLTKNKFPKELINITHSCLRGRINLVKAKAAYKPGETILQLTVDNYYNNNADGKFALPAEYKHIINQDKIYKISDHYNDTRDLGDNNTRLGRELLGMTHGKKHKRGLYIAVGARSVQVLDIKELGE